MKYVTFLLAFLVVASSHANASTTILSTLDDTLMDGHPVDVQATFTTGPDYITVVIDNLQSNPKSVVQNLSGLWFIVSTGQTAGTLDSSLGVPRWVADAKEGGTYTDGPAGSTGWELGTNGVAMYLHVLETAVTPTHLIIGPPDDVSEKYPLANGSIAGNPAHNPFLAESATFMLSVEGVTATSTITDAIFEFGTSPGDVVITPEPATMSLMVIGAVAMIRRKRQK